MSFSLSSVLPTLHKGLDLLDELLPMAEQIGGIVPGAVGNAIKIGAAIYETAQNIFDRVEEGKIVASSDDQDQLKTILASIRAKNDELRNYIAAH